MPYCDASIIYELKHFSRAISLTHKWHVKNISLIITEAAAVHTMVGWLNTSDKSYWNKFEENI